MANDINFRAGADPSIDFVIQKNDNVEHTLLLKNFKKIRIYSDTLSNITEIDIPDDDNTGMPMIRDVETWSDISLTFKGLANLKKVRLPNYLTAIPNEMFSGCSSLTSVNIPTSLTQIKVNAFKNCISLPALDIPNTVYVANTAFTNVSSMSSYVEQPTEEIEGDHIVLKNYTLDDGCPWIDNPNSTYEIEVDESVTELPAYWLYGTSEDEAIPNVAKITINADSITIGKYAFGGAYNLTSLVINSNEITDGSDGYGSITDAWFFDGEMYEKYPEYYKCVYCDYNMTEYNEQGYCRIVDGVPYLTNEEGDYINTDGLTVDESNRIDITTLNTEDTNYRPYPLGDWTMLPMSINLIVDLPNIELDNGDIPFDVSVGAGLSNVPLFKLSDGKYYRYVFERISDTSRRIVLNGPEDAPYDIVDYDTTSSQYVVG